jgi:hypothetical protein
MIAPQCSGANALFLSFLNLIGPSVKDYSISQAAPMPSPGLSAIPFNGLAKKEASDQDKLTKTET